MEEKKLTAEDLLKAVEKIKTEPFGVEDRRVVVRFDDLAYVIDRLQSENEILKKQIDELPKPRKKILANRVYSDSTLKGWKKEDLIEQIRILEHNWAAAEEALNNSSKNAEKLLAEQKAEIERLTELKTVKTVYCNGENNGLRITFFHKNEEVGEASVCDYQGKEDNFLHGVEVKEQYRGQGYGRMIVEYMTTHYPVDTLYVEKANNAAIGLYERFGFALTCDTFDKDGKTMAVMARGQELYKQAVKDTAKEIFAKADELHMGSSNAHCLVFELERWIKERYGVEVE